MQTYTFCCMPARVLVSQRIEVKPITLFETCQKAEINNHIVRLTFLIQASFPLNTYNAHLIMVVAISSFASWVTSDIWLVSFNSRTAVVTEFIVRNSKKLNF